MFNRSKIDWTSRVQLKLSLPVTVVIEFYSYVTSSVWTKSKDHFYPEDHFYPDSRIINQYL